MVNSFGFDPKDSGSTPDRAAICPYGEKDIITDF